MKRKIFTFFIPKFGITPTSARNLVEISWSALWAKNAMAFLGFIAGMGVFFLAAGCAPVKDTEEIKKAIIALDPSFKDVLVKKDQIDSLIEVLRDDFQGRQAVINSKIMELEEELKGIRRRHYVDAHELASQLDTERQRIKANLNELNTELRNKQGLVNTLKNSMRQTKKMLENKYAGLSDRELTKWRGDLHDLTVQISQLEAEAVELRRQMGLRRQQLNLLKF